MRDFERDRPTPDADPRARRHRADPGSTPRSRPAQSPALDAATVMRLQRTAGNAGRGPDARRRRGAARRSTTSSGSGGGSPLDDGHPRRRWSRRSARRSRTSASTPTTGRRSRPSRSARTPTRSGPTSCSSAASSTRARRRGQRTIAHELSHVVQQSQGPVDGSDAPGGIRVSDPSDRFEQAAEHHADQVMSSVGSVVRASVGGVGAGRRRAARGGRGAAVPALQREEAPEEDEMPDGG